VTAAARTRPAAPDHELKAFPGTWLIGVPDAEPA